MACVDEITAIACEIKPDEATLVPERRAELTTEGGLDVVANKSAVEETTKRLVDAGIEVSLFIDPDVQQIEMAKLLGAKAIEIQTARYSEARSPEGQRHELNMLRESTTFAHNLGLHVHMGHGLNYMNVIPIVSIDGVEELNIGHSIISRAVLVGMERAVREMKEVILNAH
jgi:pyridoxine 5-phosphate synthase